MTKELGIEIVDDDLFATNTKRVRAATTHLDPSLKVSYFWVSYDDKEEPKPKDNLFP